MAGAGLWWYRHDPPPSELQAPESRDLWTKARRGEAKAQAKLGWKYYRGEGARKDLTKAAEWFRKAADQGDATAQRNLGVMYHGGEGVPKDLMKAAEWLRKAADQGDATAQLNLGVMYAGGEGVPKDVTTAVRWYRRAAEQGDTQAQVNLGALCYFGAEGLSQDLAQAVEWYRKAADQGNATAQTWLAVMYSLGQGVPKDVPKAVEWYHKAAKQGDVNAQLNLGGLYYQGGDGVAKDLTKAAEWFQKAADQGDLEAQFYLGVMYHGGEGLPRDLAKAAEWYQKAAERGHALAQFNLGAMYAFGVGVPRDYVRAYAWFNLAAARGNKDGIAARDRLERDLTPEQLREGQRLARVWKAKDPAEKGQDDTPRQEKLGRTSTGSGFFVSSEGHLLTNQHVVDGCGEVRLAGAEKALRVLVTDASNDLALLASGTAAPATLPLRTSGVAQGETVFAYGYPYEGALASGGGISVGYVNALSGLGNNSNQIQISIPIQAGNSGGPVLDRKGRLVGVISMKLDALKVARATGTVPENVGFAVNLATTRSFLEGNNVPYRQSSWFTWSKDPEEIATAARAASVLIECWK